MGLTDLFWVLWKGHGLRPPLRHVGRNLDRAGGRCHRHGRKRQAWPRRPPDWPVAGRIVTRRTHSQGAGRDNATIMSATGRCATAEAVFAARRTGEALA